MKCPRDSTGLASMAGSTRGILFCPTCNGMWVRKSHFRNLLRGSDLAVGSPGIGSAPPVAGQRHAPISCPADHVELMLQKVYDGIQVDICKSHQAFWLDGGEYDKLLAIHKAKRGYAEEDVSVSSDAGELAVDIALEVVLNNPELVIGAADLASEVAEAVFEFILEVLADIL